MEIKVYNNLTLVTFENGNVAKIKWNRKRWVLENKEVSEDLLQAVVPEKYVYRRCGSGPVINHNSIDEFGNRYAYIDNGGPTGYVDVYALICISGRWVRIKVKSQILESDAIEFGYEYENSII